MNNTNYIVFAERSLNQALYKKERLKRIQIAYKQAAVLGDEISVSTKLTSDLTDHQLSSSSDPGKSFARVRFFWNSKSK